MSTEAIESHPDKHHDIPVYLSPQTSWNTHETRSPHTFPGGRSLLEDPVYPRLQQDFRKVWDMPQPRSGRGSSLTRRLPGRWERSALSKCLEGISVTVHYLVGILWCWITNWFRFHIRNSKATTFNVETFTKKEAKFPNHPEKERCNPLPQLQTASLDALLFDLFIHKINIFSSWALMARWPAVAGGAWPASVLRVSDTSSLTLVRHSWSIFPAEY